MSRKHSHYFKDCKHLQGQLIIINEEVCMDKVELIEMLHDHFTPTNKLVDWWDAYGWIFAEPTETDPPISKEEFYRWWGNMETWWVKQGVQLLYKPPNMAPNFNNWKYDSMLKFFDNEFEYLYAHPSFYEDYI